MKRNKMGYILRQVVNSIMLFILLVIMSFILPRLIPGNPISIFQEDVHIFNTVLPEDTFNRFQEYYAPHLSLREQFIIYIKNITSFDLGYSFYYGYPVVELINGRIGWTLILSIMSILIASFIAIPMGIKSALSSKSITDKMLMYCNVLLQGIPIFLVALLIQRFFAYKLQLFPSQGAYSLRLNPTVPIFIMDAMYHMILPLLTSTIALIPSNYLLTRNVVMRIKEEPYVKLAYYNNVHEASIKYHYIFKNSLPEIISKLNIHFVYAVAGTLFVEMIFNYPGIGGLLRIAVSSRDYPLIQGIFLYVAIYAIVINIIFEWILYEVSPRLKL
ncbi:ABC transporter permease [Natronincola ferrireducens]|uniref:Peptide/nickel transport system permease protein n=1 Tax=Natronincola ferrireducens TaxID=393762 RepID=A0A1G9GL85_9FIRM|nr:ABC transporter permease [Natronincola ferrireducens]SDL01458.1 peptide/nickel transport system permease protein [Natronincola ferrireducens]